MVSENAKLSSRNWYYRNRERALRSNKKWRDGNKEKMKVYAKTFYHSNKRAYFAYSLKNTYSLSLAQFDSMLIEQSGRCLVCNDPMEDPSVDHNHACCPGKKSCGKCIRGLLHRSCNAALGYLKDSVERAQAAVDYLKRPNKKFES